MAVVTSSISSSAASKTTRRKSHRVNTGLQTQLSKSTQHRPNQSKPRSKPASSSMADESTSEATRDVLAALEALDFSITGTSIPADKSTYLTSPTLIERWQVELNAQLSVFLGGGCTPEMFESRLQVILADVESLEKTRDAIQRDESAGKQAWKQVNERCREIEGIFEELERRLDS